MLALHKPPLRPPHLTPSRTLSKSTKPILHIPSSSIYPLGAGSTATPLFPSVSWTIQPSDAWVVTSLPSSGSKTSLLRALTGHLRIHPPPPPPHGLFPFLAHTDPLAHVRLVSFAHRPRGAGGAFYDFSARYGAVRDEDKRTLRETFFPELAKPLHTLAIPDLLQRTEQQEVDARDEEGKRRLLEDLTSELGLTPFLDLPLVALSNGQTRKARIAKALLEQPALLILDEPLTGLDIHTRASVLSLLHAHHTTNAPHIVLGMRPQDPLPEWTTHVALVRADGSVHAGEKERVLDAVDGEGKLYLGWDARSQTNVNPQKVGKEKAEDEGGEALVELKGVNVSYGDRKVLKDIHWTIRPGSRWHLIGANGAGKTTLLALLTGDHPQSYTQSSPTSSSSPSPPSTPGSPPTSRLTLFTRPRQRWATPHLHALIGRVSPELHNAFPRRAALSVWDAVGTGFEGNFVPRGKRRVGYAPDGAPFPIADDDVDGHGQSEEETWRVGRVWEVLEALGPASWDSNVMHPTTRTFATRPFASLTPGEQSSVLLMRPLVGRPPLVLLDEAWAGMDERMVRSARSYLRGEGLEGRQACVVVSHWSEEVPWGVEDGVRRFRLEGGEGWEE
ncbi:P-loop containing nucleoside triphosphate hydrolase protein [Trametopsis cervina]|nr:P-loop containing nucleoside triphosphate hydrolase protein [Trametopsis cervina]